MELSNLNKNKVNIIVNILISFLFVLLFILFYLPNYMAYVNNNYKYTVIDVFSSENLHVHDCIINDDGLKITGEDPYIIIPGCNVPIYDITMDYSLIEGKIDYVKFYFDYGSNFNENDTKEMHSINNVWCYDDEIVKNFRVDLEGTDISTIVKLNNIQLNSNENKEFLDKIYSIKYFIILPIQMIFFLTLYFMSGLCDYRYKLDFIYSIIYFILVTAFSLSINNIWATEVSNFVKIISLIILGLLSLFVCRLITSLRYEERRSKNVRC